jgi:hypothetical protein
VLISAGIGLLSSFTTDRAQPRFVFAAFNRSGEPQYSPDLIFSSLGGGALNSEEHQLMLATRRLDLPKVLEEDFRYLFPCNKSELETKCQYREDPPPQIEP